MKQYITMLSLESGGYRFVEPLNYKFGTLAEIVSNSFQRGQLIDWLWNENEVSLSSEWITMDKERGGIALYDISASMDETYCGNYIDPTKRFVMSVKNFAELMIEWDTLRVSRPDTILLVIDDNDYVSLESDPAIIQEYQDAGYEFDVTKNPATIHEFMFLKKNIQGYLDYLFNNFTSLHYMLAEVLFVLHVKNIDISFQESSTIVIDSYNNTIVYFDIAHDTVYVGAIGSVENHEENQARLHPDNVLKYISSRHSFKMSYQDFITLKKEWDEILQMQTPYFMLYDDEQDNIFCKGFNTTDDMINFVKQSMPDQGKMVGDFNL